jgi:hypothetical protein
MSEYIQKECLNCGLIHSADEKKFEKVCPVCGVAWGDTAEVEEPEEELKEVESIPETVIDEPEDEEEKTV